MECVYPYPYPVIHDMIQSGSVFDQLFRSGTPLIPPFVKYNSFPTSTTICGGGVCKKGQVNWTDPILLAMGDGEASLPLQYNKSIVLAKSKISMITEHPHLIKVAARCSNPRVNSIRGITSGVTLVLYRTCFGQ